MSSITFIDHFQIPKGPFQSEKLPIGVAIIEGVTSNSIPVIIDGKASKYSLIGIVIPEICDISTWTVSHGSNSLINSKYNIAVYGSNIKSEFAYGFKTLNVGNLPIDIAWHYIPGTYVSLKNSDATQDPIIRIDNEHNLESIQTKDGTYSFPAGKRVFTKSKIQWTTSSRQLRLTHDYRMLTPIDYVFNGQSCKVKRGETLIISY